MSEGYEYNLLTQELLLQGYTAEHYPDYVRIGNGRLGKSPLENSCGGFIYTKDYLEKKAFMSGCGLYVSWEKCINDIDYLEETFCFENDNVVFRCPWHKKNCEQNHPLLREDNFGFCACHMVSDYQYEKNTHSDSQFLKETVNAMEKTEKPTVLITDGAYSGRDNTDAAAEKNIDLVTTDLFPKSADRAEIVVHFLTQNRANSGYLLFYMKFSRNIDFYGR